MPNWSAAFETGHPQIDDEHREFFRQLKALRETIEAGGGREQVVELIRILQKYATGHFCREEAHMLRVACPAREANCAAHREFAAKLEGWLNLLTLGGAPLSLTHDIQRESSAWIRAHIVNVDCELRHCTRP
jgi:hemerythrin